MPGTKGGAKIYDEKVSPVLSRNATVALRDCVALRDTMLRRRDRERPSLKGRGMW